MCRNSNDIPMVRYTLTDDIYCEISSPRTRYIPNAICPVERVGQGLAPAEKPKKVKACSRERGNCMNNSNVPYIIEKFDKYGNILSEEAHNMDKFELPEGGTEQFLKYIAGACEKYFQDAKNVERYKKWKIERDARKDRI